MRKMRDENHGKGYMFEANSQRENRNARNRNRPVRHVRRSIEAVYSLLYDPYKTLKTSHRTRRFKMQWPLAIAN